MKFITKRYNYHKRFWKKGNLPDFLILGAQKAGTTSLFNYINNYSQVFLTPEDKELYFFTEHYEKGINYYSSHFPKAQEGKITGEATPDYLYFHQAPKRVKEHLGDIKFIVLLRNPIERLVSHYNFMNYTNKTRAYDPEPLDLAVKHEKNWFDLDEDVKLPFHYGYKYYSYKSRGVYHLQLKRWFSHFPRENFLILEFDEFTRNTRDKLEQVFSFLGLDGDALTTNEFPVYNKNTKKDSLDPKTMEYLQDFFEPHNEALFKLLGREFAW